MGASMKVTNPRIVLTCLLAIAVLWAYCERPRVRLGFGTITGKINVRPTEVGKVDVRSGGFLKGLEEHFTSATFMRKLCASQPRFFRPDTSVVVRHVGHHGLDEKPVVAQLVGSVTDAFQGQSIAFLLWDVDNFDPPGPLDRPFGQFEPGLSVMYFLPEAYRVEQPTYPWILWFQAHLPGMPDTANLAAEAEAANEVVKDDFEKQVRFAIEDSVASSKK